jgi:hypothetical protein
MKSEDVKDGKKIREIVEQLVEEVMNLSQTELEL